MFILGKGPFDQGALHGQFHPVARDLATTLHRDISITRLTAGGGLFPPDLRNYCTDLQNSNGARYTWKFYRGKPNVVDLGVIDDDLLNDLTICHVRFCGHYNRIKWK